MSTFSRPCRTCGRRSAPGEAYCSACLTNGRQRPSSCRICGARTEGGPYCPQHSAAFERLEAQPWRAGYRGRAYRAARERRYEIAGGRCEICGEPLGRGWECDHLVPLRDGGTNDAANLRAYCAGCHHKKTAADRRRRKKEA